MGKLAKFLNSLIDKMAAKGDLSRAEIIASMAAEAGIAAGTVNQILDGGIARPPDERLIGFGRALGVSFKEIKAALPEDLREAQGGAFLEALDAKGGKPASRFLIRVLRAGLSGNGNFYPDRVLKKSVALFDDVRVFVKGDQEHERGQGKDFRNLVGRLVEPRFVEGQGRDSGEIRATLELIEPEGPIAVKMREAWDRGMTGLFGFSIDALGRVKSGSIGGRKVIVADAFNKIQSVDLIVEPGAGGQVINLIESQKGKTMDEDEFLSQREIRLMVEASKLPKAAQGRLIEAHGEAEDLTETSLREAIKKEQDYIAQFRESDSGTVRGLGDFARVEEIEGRPAKVEKMLDAFLDPQDRSVTSIRECYLDTTGDRRFTGMLRDCDQSRFRESLASTTFPQALGDSVARQMIKLFNKPSIYDVWRELVRIVPVNDFRVQRRTRIGGYGDLPAVLEGASYDPLTSPTDEEATYQITKRGGTEDLTLETIVNDDVGMVLDIPVKLTRSAKRSLGKFVLDNLRTNPAIYDSLALFHATHNNLGTAALSAASVAAGRLAVKDQVEKDSLEKLGIPVRNIWVPDALEETAVDLFRRNTENDKTFVQSLALQVMPVWYWTDANDWYLTADKDELPTVELGFFQGQEEPELFIQDQPGQGSQFTNDKTTYKIRHIYGSTVTDFRGAYGSLVV